MEHEQNRLNNLLKTAEYYYSHALVPEDKLPLLKEIIKTLKGGDTHGRTNLETN